jgi:hypothetical protein
VVTRGRLNLATNEINRVKSKTYISPSNKPRGPKVGAEVQLHSFSNLGATWGPVINATPRRFYPRDRDPLPMLQEAAWAPGSVWMGVENLASNGIRSPDCPVRSGNKQGLISKGSARGTVQLTDTRLLSFPRLALLNFTYFRGSERERELTR